MIARRPSEIIGGTPLVELVLADPRKRLLLKLEKLNLAGSMKDRMARSMVDDAERKEVLRAGGTIVESSSGNTGIALAAIAAERGYRFVAVVDDHAARDKIRIMRALGAELVTVEGAAEDRVATASREALARRLGETIPGAVYLDQPDNPANGRGYTETLAREIVADVGPDLDLLVGSVGTGGSLSGTARGLRGLLPNVRVVGVEPVGSIIFGGEARPYYQSGTGTPAGVEVGRNVDRDLIDRGVKVADAVAFTTSRFLARRHGLLLGGSAGGVVHAAIAELRTSDAHVGVAIVADGGERYLDTVFDDDWIASRGLHDDAVQAELERLLVRYGPP